MCLCVYQCESRVSVYVSVRLRNRLLTVPPPEPSVAFEREGKGRGQAWPTRDLAGVAWALGAFCGPVVIFRVKTVMLSAGKDGFISSF